MDLTELWSELARLYRSQGRLDDAMAAWEEAIAAGYQAIPHPRAEIAELLLDAGRRSEADALPTQLRDACRDDVWLYNSAGWSYAHAGDDREALDWLDAGIEIALAGGDPEEILGQLMDFRRSSRAALGWDAHDELTERVAAFERAPGPRASPTGFFGGTPPEPRPCPHCGWEPTNHPPPFRADNESLTDLLLGRSRLPAPPTPVTRTKIGRNQACPCGSSLKYKHCHGR